MHHPISWFGACCLPLLLTFSAIATISPHAQSISAQTIENAPFAFIFDPRDNLLVTEVRESSGIVGQGAVTSYRLNSDGILNTISGSVPDSQTAPCWIAITPDGRYAYAVNTANAVISGYQVDSNGGLLLLGNGVAAQTSASPLDNAFTRNGQYMYVVTRSEIIGYQVHADGSLTPLSPTAALPSGSKARGLVAL